MNHLVQAISAFAETIGGPGLFLIGFLDSSFLSFPQANDLLVILMVLHKPALMPYYALMATLGSIAGCLVLHAVARRGGESYLSRHVAGPRAQWAMRLMERYGVLAVLVPSLLPPPAPFKLFVLLAGVAGMPRSTFGLTIAVGRGIRYFGQGLLALWYGERAITFMRLHAREVSIGLAVTVLALGTGYVLWRRLRQRDAVAEL